MKNWKKPNTITGSAAEGLKYFKRPFIEDRIWNEIEKGNHVLFLAPRRVGKSSVVMFMSKNNRKFYRSMYKNIQTDSSIMEFYKRMFSMVLSTLTNADKMKIYGKQWMKTLEIKSITASGVDFGKKEWDYRDLFFELISKLKEQDNKIVLFLDEFPDVLNNIYENHGKREAVSLLDDLRSLRHNKEFKKVFVLVLLGSVGLNHMVKKITGRIDKVNDLHKEYLAPLTIEEGPSFIQHLVGKASMQLSSEVANYLLEKLGHHIPIYIQLLIEECDDLLCSSNRTDLTIEDVDLAYRLLLKKHQHFSDWDDRLKEYYDKKYPFLQSVLNHAAHNDGISIQEIYDIAVSKDFEESFKADIDDIMLADGYLFETDDNNYYFNSPLLKDWWKSRHPIMKKQ